MNSPALLDVRNLKVRFTVRSGTAKVLDGVTFKLQRGEILGLVGESGSGKSATALAIMKLLARPSGRIAEGEILLDGEDLVPKSEKEMRVIRGGRIALILQDPMSSLNPVMTIGEQVAEAVRQHQVADGASLWTRVRDSLSLMKIPAPEARMSQYPHQMSGGMRQRVVGAIAMSCHPSLLIADEPTTSLDVTIQAQFLAHLRRLRTRLKLGIILITHDLTAVASTCDRVAIMYAGRVVENGTTSEVFRSPRHPYTQGLLASSVHQADKRERLESIPGTPPDPSNRPAGCPFAPRCRQSMEICTVCYPPQSEFNDGHTADCWLYAEAESVG